ncbi:ATP-binding protein [Streptomyces sp. NPDC058685]|uniref:ATP-binding protein n=1 Tax=Streptomyces sp. NPDC058685 TaxID=3346598 RepID=UPI0036673870
MSLGRRDVAPSPADVRVILPHSPRAAQMARALARDITEGRVDPETTEETLLVVSELVTNSVIHALPPLVFELTVTHDHTGRVGIHIEVTDGGPNFEASLLPDDEHGRGACITQSLARETGGSEGPAGGTHWADMIDRTSCTNRAPA